MVPMMAATASPTRIHGHHDVLLDSSPSLRLVETVSGEVANVCSASEDVTGGSVRDVSVGGGTVAGGDVAGGTVRGGKVRGGSVGGGAVGGGTVRGGTVRGGWVGVGCVGSGCVPGGTVSDGTVGIPLDGGSVPNPGGRVAPGGRVTDPPPEPAHDTATIATAMVNVANRTTRIA